MKLRTRLLLQPNWTILLLCDEPNNLSSVPLRKKHLICVTLGLSLSKDRTAPVIMELVDEKNLNRN